MSLIDITDRMNARRAVWGLGALMTCECQMQAEQPVGFLPTIIRDARGEIVTGLACAACGRGYVVNAGRIEEE